MNAHLLIRCFGKDVVGGCPSSMFVAVPAAALGSAEGLARVLGTRQWRLWRLFWEGKECLATFCPTCEPSLAGREVA